MRETKTNKLLKEMFELYVRYGPNEFRKAINLIESGEATAPLSRLGLTIDNSSRPAVASRRKKTKSAKERLRLFVDKLHEASDPSTKSIAEFVDGIVKRDVLGTSALLRQYLELLSIPYSDKIDRNVIALQIGKFLLNESPQARTEHMNLAHQIGGKHSSLQAWSDLIVKRKD